MIQTSRNVVEHVVVSAEQSYEEVIRSLEARLGVFNGDELRSQLAGPDRSWDRAAEAIERQAGASGFVVFQKIEYGELLSLAGSPRRVSRYAIGNPLLAIAMIKEAPAAALYAPLTIAVYDGSDEKAVIAYDRFSSLLSRFQSPEVTRTAEVVEEKLEALIAEATGPSREPEERDA